ncbi:histidine-containing phosphotransfer protein 1-like isoform X2 [Coffea eugenioides]|uniref:Histidine-containing phosphotransfer protein n=1 Tax=Coffea arabica TaxID=13443 RepID=A0A6P6V4G2_COFAR|nr:histidine-containing phosphotransfer protein 1-like isoform X2 [Coffea arabica]XP_027170322.1 histidine-containing phosphotransfer protein 1-like isoform X2 [Coffea eugenioides]
MEVAQLQKRFLELISTVYQEGFLDDQFVQLQKLQDESNPDFVVEVVSLFFEDSEKLLNNVATALIGAQRVKNACGAFRNFCEEKNLDGCLKCLQHVKNEYALVKRKLEYLFMLEQQIVAAGGMIPVIP